MPFGLDSAVARAALDYPRSVRGLHGRARRFPQFNEKIGRPVAEPPVAGRTILPTNQLDDNH